MSRVGNIALIVVLCGGLLAAATVFALRDSQPSQPGGPTVDVLISELGSEDDGVSRNAEIQLRELGKETLPYLDQASKSSDPHLASRARKLMRELVDADGVQ